MNTGEIEKLFITIGADLNEALAGLKQLEREYEATDARIQRAGARTAQAYGATLQKELRKVGSDLTGAGRTLTLGLTVPIVGAGAAALKMGIDFESAFAGVRKTVDATEEEFAVLRQGIRDMAKEMPESAVGISRVAEAAGQLGIAKEDILEFTRNMVMLGATTNLSSDEAATGLARLSNIMQDKNFSQIGAALVDLGNKGASTEREILDMALRIAGAGKVVGLTTPQVLGFANALSSVGIEAEAGGTAISRVMLNIAAAVGEGGDKLKGFAMVAGLTAKEFAGLFRRDAAEAIVAFVDGLGDIQDAAGPAGVLGALEALDLKEIRVRDTLLRSVQAREQLKKSLDDGATAYQQNIALTDEYAKRVETAEAKLKIFWNRLVDVGITLGDALIPALTDALDASEPFLDIIVRLANAFAGLPRPIQAVVIVFAALLAVLGPALIAIGAMSTGIATLIPFLGAMRVAVLAASGPWGILAAAILGAAAALVIFDKQNDKSNLAKAYEEQQRIAEELQQKGVTVEAHLPFSRSGLPPNLPQPGSPADRARQAEIARLQGDYERINRTIADMESRGQGASPSIDTTLLEEQREAAARTREEIEALTQGLGSLGEETKETKEDVLTLTDALEDNSITLAEAWELGLTPAMAGLAEASELLMDAQYEQASATFELQKTAAKLAEVFKVSREEGEKLVRVMRQESLEKLRAALGSLGGPSQEQAQLLAQVADLDFIIAGLENAAAQSGIENSQTIEQYKRVREALQSQVNVLEAETRAALAHAQAVDATLPTQAELIDNIKELTGWVARITEGMRGQTPIYAELNPALAEFFAHMRNINTLLGAAGIPSFDVGSSYVPMDMLALVHKGEAIIPAMEAERLRNGASFGGGDSEVTVPVQVIVDGEIIWESVERRQTRSSTIARRYS